MADQYLTRNERYFTKAQLLDLLDDYIDSNTVTVSGAISEAGREKVFYLICEKIAGDMWDSVSNAFSGIMSFVTFRKEYYESQNIWSILEAFKQIVAYGGRGAVRFKTEIYKTQSHERRVKFVNSIRYGSNY